MSKGTGDKLEGKANEIEGSTKQGIGRVMGDDNIHSDGAIDKAKGKGKEALGGAKDMVETAGDKLGDAVGNVKRKMD